MNWSSDQAPGLEESYKLETVLAIYKGEIEYHNMYYIESHGIELKDKKPQLLAGKPLTQDQLKSLVVGFDEATHENAGFFSSRLLSYTNKAVKKHLLWWIPPGAKELSFSESSKMPSGVMGLPALLFYVKSSSLNVFAMKSKRRPSEKTRLYHAPLFNVYEGGSVCMGNVKLPSWEGSANEIISQWEKAFFESEFNDHLGDKKTHLPTKEPYPINTLIPYGRKMTLGDLIRRESI